MQEGGTQWKATVQSEHGLPRCAAGWGKEERDGTARFNNVLEIRVQECTRASDTVRHTLQNAPKTKEKWKSGSHLKMCPTGGAHEATLKLVVHTGTTSNVWTSLSERVLIILHGLLEKPRQPVEPRTQHAHMCPVCSSTLSQSWRSDDITRKL